MGSQWISASAAARTFEELHEYCLRVASAVGLICIEIFGYRNADTRDYAIALGVALQLTNIVRDVSTDLATGRIYLPTEDLRRFGCTDDDLRAGLSEPVRALLEFECERARSFYAKARAALPDRGRPPVGGGGDHGRHLPERFSSVSSGAATTCSLRLCAWRGPGAP